jgi:hypothetical protein
MRYTMRHKKLVSILAALLIVYALAGFFLLPAVVKPKLVSALEQSTGRKVHLATLRTNPFTFSATLGDFSLLDRDSSMLVSFKELYVRYRVTSLFRREWGLAQFHLDTPYVAVRILSDGSLSVSDLLGSQRADSSAPGDAPRAMEIGDMRIAGGTIMYQDLSRTEPLTKVIDSLDLVLKDFTTVPQTEGTYEFEAVTRQNERLHWRGNIALSPLRSAGLIEMAGIRVRTLTDFMGDRLRFSAPSGTFSARAEYALNDAPGGAAFALRSGSLDVADLVLTSGADSLPPVALPEVHIKGIALDEPRNTAVIEEIRVLGGSLRTGYLADGTLTLQQVLTPVPRPGDTSGGAMQITVGKLTAANLSFFFTDRTVVPDAPVSLTGIGLDLAGLVYGGSGTARVSASAVLNGGGTLHADGSLSLQPRRCDLDLTLAGSPLAALEPYVARHSRAEILGGTFGLRGKFSYAAGSGVSDIRFRGGVTSEKVRIGDPVIREDLIRWDRLELRNVDYRTIPPSMAIAGIVATRPYARVIVGKDRTLNLQHLRIADSTSSVGNADSSAAPAASPGGKPDTAGASLTAKGLKPDAPGASLTTIGAIRFVDGSMNFADLSLSPNFTTGIQKLQGSITELSSKQLARADVDLAGSVDGYAPVTIRGQINPLSDVAYTDVVMAFNGIELTTFTPYFSKFAGYKIERGKLTMNLRYRLNASHLDAENKIVLNQLTLGDKVESPDATSLPVKLAVALLKDSKGVIDLDIPVSGSLDDPEFSFFPIILKVLMNLLWKMVTAPFALLGSLFGGGGDDLQFVAFAPGVDTLAHDQFPKLQTVARGLTARPALQIEIRGASSPVDDRRALAEASVLSKIRTRGAGPLRLTRPEEKRLLEVYREAFREDPENLIGAEKPESGSQDSIVISRARERLVDSVQVPDSDLRSLAQRRAAGIRGYLSGSATIDPGRIFLLEVDAGANAVEGLIRATLTLNAQ